MRLEKNKGKKEILFPFNFFTEGQQIKEQTKCLHHVYGI